MKETRVLGDYSLIKQIGQGALGAVFLAEHRFMKKHFALKVFPEDLCSDRGFIQRFEDEVSQLSLLEHPNIVKLHNISYDQGVYFLVTDCVVDEFGENTNLAHFLQAKDYKISEDEIYSVLKQIAAALDYAHNFKGEGRGIAHRGIKLNNILTSKGSDGLHLYLSDYGLSKIIGSATFLTRTYKVVAETIGLGKKLQCGAVDKKKVEPLHNSFLQSYNFLAPEQKLTDADQTVDFKADVYAFGILTYYLLMGKYPQGYFEMPSENNSNLKYNWDDLIKRSLAPDPTNRPGELLQFIKYLKEGNLKRVPVFTAAAATRSDLPTKPIQKEKPSAASFGQIETNLMPVYQAQHLERPIIDHDPAKTLQVDPTIKQYTPELKEEKYIEPLLTDMVAIEGGTFYRGSNEGNRDEMPKHQITIESFALDIHPVTNEQFVRFLEAMGGVKDSNHNDIIRQRDSRINSSKGKFSIESGYIKHPVVGVTWYGAVAYAKWIGKRLPTEAESEIATSCGINNYPYPTGEDIEKNQANFFSSDTTAVMSYKPNEFGLYDMAGNVYEWSQDWYGYNYYETSVQEPVNPKGPLQGVYRVLRGGCWKSLKEDLRCSRRHRNNPGTVNGTYGFRLATDVKPES